MSEVAVPFGDLVGEVKRVAKYGRDDFGDDPMVLVGVRRGWRDYEIGLTASRQHLERLLDSVPDRR
jgi:hypothetical protein